MTDTHPFNILIFSKTAGYRHASIPSGISAIQKLTISTNPCNVTASEDAEAMFTPSALSTFHVIILLHTSGTFLTPTQLSSLQDFVHSGGGVVSIHGSASGMPSSPWFGKLIGAHFDMHPDSELGSFLSASSSTSFPLPTVSDHYILRSLAPPEKWMDEWYNFKTHPAENGNLTILLRGDTKSFKGGKHGEDHPLVWCQEFEEGRSVYVALGHFDDAYGDEWYMGLIERGVLWAARKDERETVAR